MVKEKIEVEKQELIFTPSDITNVVLSIEGKGEYDTSGYIEIQLKVRDTVSSLRFFTENIDATLSRLSFMLQGAKVDLYARRSEIAMENQ